MMSIINKFTRHVPVSLSYPVCLWYRQHTTVLTARKPVFCVAHIDCGRNICYRYIPWSCKHVPYAFDGRFALRSESPAMWRCVSGWEVLDVSMIVAPSSSGSSSWKQYNPSKRRALFPLWHNVTSQETLVFSNTAVRTQSSK
jgi:hypothetical protein